ncbi:ABC transporter permease [Mangrovibacterium marinum]|uniref:ABC-2 type transport system permease protein n=1 Tax=Mangrovibacterium marinum TaxID=1639118 RepID=A0A2T5C4X2_9BACT|nr:ABC transporter permease [Mangrovibacterium marinum]PTN09909.1 ABC-2 type transport system permease protein [Mangrovibacterium marinum]
MDRFLGFVKKEFFHIFRDRRTMIILFGIPIIQLMLFGTVITNEIKDARIAIYDQSKDEVTQEITTKLMSSGYFLLDQNLESTADIEAIFKQGKVKEVLVFGRDFSRKLQREGKADVQIIADASDPNLGKMLATYTTGIINDYIFKQMGNLHLPMQIEPEVRMVYNEGLKSVYMFVPGIMAMILMLISAMMTSISITREKELGTMEILLVSPLRPSQIILGKVTPYLVLSFINALVILGIGHFVFGVPIKGSWGLLLGESILFILMALSLGIMISSLAKTQMVAMFISVIALMLPTILLSGFIFSIENMPLPLQIVSNIMPPKWFIIILRNIMLKGVGMAYVWKETLVLLGMTAFFVVVAVKKFKVRLE